MRYTYYPGCSLESTARPYDMSLRAVFRRLELDLQELDDWNCCGATAYTSVAETMALAVSARNLALAERDGADLVAPCSACYLVLQKTHRFLAEQPELRRRVGEALAAGNLAYTGTVRVRHPLEVLMNDVGLEAIAAQAVRSLEGARVAPYYGCQIVRPERGFDDREAPMMLDTMFRRLGAAVVDFPMKVRCCGGMLMTTAEDVGQRLSGDILACALDAGANVIVTTCPLCQINLEAYQAECGRAVGRRLAIPILFFPQLLGLALGASAKELGLPLGLVPLGAELASLAETSHV
jgi:heterodisulfide reductase subunit B